MYRKTATLVGIAMTTLTLGMASASAADKLSADQIKTMFNGKTVEAYSELRGIKQTTYFTPDGRMVQANGAGEKLQGVWRADASGKHCVKWAGKEESCHEVLPQADGTFKKLENGKHIVTIQKIIDGNPGKL